MRLAGRDVMQEELAVQQHVVAGEEVHDLRVDLAVGFLPDGLGHDVLPWDWGWVVWAHCWGLGRACGPAPRYPSPTPSVTIAVNSSSPSAILIFCIAWVAAPLSRLSRVATITTRRPSADTPKPPISAWCRPAIRLTHGGSSTTRTSRSPPYRSRKRASTSSRFIARDRYKLAVTVRPRKYEATCGMNSTGTPSWNEASFSWTCPVSAYGIRLSRSFSGSFLSEGVVPAPE